MGARKAEVQDNTGLKSLGVRWASQVQGDWGQILKTAVG